MTTHGLRERIFLAEDLPELPDLAPLGLFILVTAECPLQTGQRWCMPSDPSRSVLFEPAHSPERVAELRHTRGIVGLTLHDGGSVGARTRLSLVFAEHLHNIRSETSGTCHAYLTSARKQPLKPTQGLRAILHFVTRSAMRSHEADGWADDAIWEWASPAEIERWYGGPPPDPRVLHGRVQDLLALRRAIRENRLGDSRDVRELLEHLQERYFSGLFVLTHHRLVTRLLTDPAQWRT